jgi:hypothetical protein
MTSNKLTQEESDQLDTTVNTILDAFKRGDVPKDEARATLTHIMHGALYGPENGGDFHGWLKPETVKAWLETIKADRRLGLIG